VNEKNGFLKKWGIVKGRTSADLAPSSIPKYLYKGKASMKKIYRQKSTESKKVYPTKKSTSYCRLLFLLLSPGKSISKN